MNSNSIDNAEDHFRKKLARWLGISFDELEEYAEDVAVNNDSTDRKGYGYYLQFSDATPPEITDKIKRLDNNYAIYFNLEELDAPIEYI